jgi:hypothetical protein
MIQLLHHYPTQDISLKTQNRVIILEKENISKQIEESLKKFSPLSQYISFEIDTSMLKDALSSSIYDDNIALFININSLDDIKEIFLYKEKLKEIFLTFELHLNSKDIFEAINQLRVLQKNIDIPFYKLKELKKEEFEKIFKLMLIDQTLFQTLFPFSGISASIIDQNQNVNFWILADEIIDETFFIDSGNKVALSKRLAKNDIFFADGLNILKIKRSSNYQNLKKYLKNPPSSCKECQIFSQCKAFLKYPDSKYDCQVFVGAMRGFIDDLKLLVENYKKQDSQKVSSPKKEPKFLVSDKQIFSLPFFSAMENDFFYKNFLPFLQEYKEYIYDIYFTCNIPPFLNDAMGCADMAEHDGEGSLEQTKRILTAMLDIQEQYGIKVSATFNNIHIDPNEENLNLFMENLQPLYEAGLRSMTIPHYLWMLDGKLKNKFPDMTIKNTILKKVSKPQEYVDYAKIGFDVVNIDRYNLRDRDNLKRLKKAYDRYKVPMVILANEWCRGLCPAMSEHYQYNCSSSKSCSKLYFDTHLGHLTCPTWQSLEPWYNLKNANMPIFRKDVDELLEYIQIFKLHGRNDFGLMQQSMDIVKRYANSEEIVFKELYDFMMYHKYDQKKIRSWNEFTKNCKFECWSCHACEELHKSGELASTKSGEMIF